MKIVRAKTEADIVEIIDYVHDEDNDLDNISLDKNSRILTLPCQAHLLEEKRKTKRLFIFPGWEIPIVEAKLLFKNVLKYNVKDEAGIGGGTINIIRFNDNIVTVECDPLAEIRIEVSKFELELHISDKIVKWS